MLKNKNNHNIGYITNDCEFFPVKTMKSDFLYGTTASTHSSTESSSFSTQRRKWEKQARSPNLRPEHVLSATSESS